MASFRFSVTLMVPDSPLIEKREGGCGSHLTENRKGVGFGTVIWFMQKYPLDCLISYISIIYNLVNYLTYYM